MRIFQAYSPKCCVQPLAVAMENMCFLPDICREYGKLINRHNCMTTHNKRICFLAQPKYHYPRYQAPCICPEVALKRIEIIRETPRYTRTEQLAYPPVWRLMALKEREPFRYFSEDRKSNIHRLLRKSLLSLYSRLANNVQPPEKKPKPKKMSDAEKEIHEKRLKELSKPKDHKEKAKKAKEKAALMSPPPPPTRGRRKKKGGKAGLTKRRLDSLSKPKLFEIEEPKEWEISPASKTYIPTERVLKLAKPKVYPFFDTDPFQIKESALRYKASDRIKELALPSAYHQKAEVKELAFRINPRALKAKTSKRVVELAEPKSYSDNNTRAHPFAVSRRALHAKLTPRIIQLARPKSYGR